MSALRFIDSEETTTLPMELVIPLHLDSAEWLAKRRYELFESSGRLVTFVGRYENRHGLVHYAVRLRVAQ